MKRDRNPLRIKIPWWLVVVGAGGGLYAYEKYKGGGLTLSNLFPPPAPAKPPITTPYDQQVLACLNSGGFWGPVVHGGAQRIGEIPSYQCWPSFEAYQRAAMMMA